MCRDSLGERDIEKKLLDVPIPSFNPHDRVHNALSELGADAHRQAQRAIHERSFRAGGSLARQRGFVRTALGDTLTEIDELVKTLLGIGS